MFESESDVSGHALLWRLAIPLAAGCCAGLIDQDRGVSIGAISSGLCWFLVVWPVIWNPRLTVHRLWSLYGVMLFAFGIGFVLSASIGAVFGAAANETFRGDGPELQSQIVWAAAMAGLFWAMKGVLAKIGRASLGFRAPPNDETGMSTPDHDVVFPEEDELK